MITAELTQKLELRVRCSAGGAGAAGLAVEVLVEAKSLGTGETNADGTAVFQLGGKVSLLQNLTVRVQDPDERFRAAAQTVPYSQLDSPVEVELER